MFDITFSSEKETKNTPEVLTSDKTEEEIKTPWRLILFNDDVHSFDEVILQLVKALNCSLEKAEQLALLAHNKGNAVVFEGDFEACLKKNSILKEIELITEIKG